MVLYCCITPERERKTARIMEALAAGCNGEVCIGDPPAGAEPFAVWGQEWLALRIIPRALKSGRPFWHIDNGFFLPANGGVEGYYRMTYRGMAAVYLPEAPLVRSQLLRPNMAPWRSEGRHVLLALPGESFGLAAGVNVPRWREGIRDRLRAATGRPIVVRPKGDPVHLSRHLRRCWALVTHSSNVAVDSVLAGVPVFVAETSPAVPVGRVDLDIDRPDMPPREPWWRSLMWQQFALDEMRSGLAAKAMAQIVALVDAPKGV
jgi:hypothetical protein